MGNNNSSPGHVNQTRSNQPYHPAYQRELPNAIIHFPVQPKLYNPEFKVLPARIPGQKLRITENGRLLQNGGTISGRREVEITPPHLPDPELLRALNRRSAIENGMVLMEPEFLTEQEKKKYYSNPDLIKDETAIVSSNPNGDVVDSGSNKYRGLFFKKKTKAPPPPQMQIPIHPLPPPHFDGMGRSPGRSESFRDPYSAVKVQPWQPRQDNTSIIRSVTPLERIVEPDSAQDRIFKTHSDPSTWETKNGDSGRPELTETQVTKLGSLPWNSKSSDRSDMSQERRFYKYKSETSEVQRRVQRKASMDRRENSEIQKRARSMDSLHVALEKEKLANLGLSPMRKSMDSLHIAAEKERLSRQHSFQSDSRHDFLLGKHSRQNSSERDYGLVNGHVKPSDLRVEALRNTASLQRNQSLSRQNSDHSSSIKDQLRSRDSSPTNWKLEPKEGSFQRKDPLPTRKYYFGGFMDNKPTSASSDRDKPFGDRVLSTSPQRSGLQRSVSNAGVFNRAEFTTSMEFLDKRDDDHRFNAHTNAITLERRPPTNGEVRRPESRCSIQRSNGSKDFPSKDSFGGSRDQEPNPRVIMRRELESRLPKQGRQRNSYAFEDRRYRHEVPVIPSPPTVREVPISRDIKENPTPEVGSDDEMDISMQLRPTLPKRMPAIPRFSPTQAWRSLNLEYITNNQRSSDRSSEDGDVFEDRIHRVTRPVAPPRAGNEKCGDSGISQDAGSPGPVTDLDLVALQDRRSDNQLPFPTPAMPDLELDPSLDFGAIERGISPVELKRTTWTPEEDLPSDFDGGSGGEVTSNARIQPNMVSVPPKLIPIKSMFSKAGEEEGEKKSTASRSKRSKAKNPGVDPNNPYTFNSMRKLKRSLSGVLGSSRGKPNEEVVQNRDENWSFSRSLPNSLHNGCDGCEEEEPRTRSNSEIGVSSHLRRAESGPIHPSMNGLVGVKGRVMSVDNLHTETFYENRLVQKYNREGPMLKYSAGEHIIYLPEYDAKRIVPKGSYDPQFDVAVIKNGFDKKKPKKFSYQSTVRQQERRRLEQKLSQEVAQKEQQREREMKLVNEVEEEFQRKREKEKATLCQQLKILSLEGSMYNDGKGRSGSNNSSDHHDRGTPPPPLLSASEMFIGEEQSSSSSPVSSQPSDNLPRSQHDSGFFGGISKWMRRQQRLEQQQQQHRGHRSRQEPDGAPSPLHNRSVSGEFQTTPPSPLDARTEILAAARYSNGVFPPEHESPLPSRSTAYGKLNKLNGREENLQGEERSSTPSGIDDRYQYMLGETVLQNKNIRRISEEGSEAIAAQVHRSSSGRAVETKAKVKEAGGRKKLFMMMINKKPSASLSGGSNSRTPSPPTGQSQYRTDLLRIDANPAGSQRSDSEGGGRLQRPRSSIEDSDHSSDTEDYEPRHHSRYRSPLTERRTPNGHSHSRSSSRNTTDSSSSCDVTGRQKNGLNPKTKMGEVNGHHSDQLKAPPAWDSDTKGSSVTSSSSFFFTPVQPFNLNKGYRPVVFNPKTRQGLNASKQFGQEVEHQRL